MQVSDQVTMTTPDEEFERWVRVDPSAMERFVRVVTEWFWDHVFRLRTYGVEHVPADGAFIACPNHSSYVDPFVQIRGMPRQVRFMAKAQLFEIPVMRSICRAGGAFPVRRGAGDQFAMELARRMLLDGQPVTVYPEGTRFREDDELGPPRRGAARLALETGMPVLPVASYGAKPRAARGEGAWPPRLPKVTTLYGPLLRFDHLDNTPENIDHVRDEIWREVTRLYALARDVTRSGKRPKTVDTRPR